MGKLKACDNFTEGLAQLWTSGQIQEARNLNFVTCSLDSILIRTKELYV